MTLKELFDRLTRAQQTNVHVIAGHIVVYDDGANIYEAYLDGQQNLVPRNAATRNALNALRG